MKKVVIIIVVLLSFGVIGFGILYVSTHDFNVERDSEQPENVELNDGSLEAEVKDQVTLEETKEIDGSFVQTYQIVNNGLEKTLEVEFLYRDNTDTNEQSLTGDYNGASLYSYYET